MSPQRLTGLVCLGLIANAIAQGSSWSQCGGIGWTGATTCVAGNTCTYLNDYYSQCIPSSVTTTSSSSTTTKATSTATTTTATTTSKSTTTSTTTTSSAASSTVTPSRVVGKTPALGWNSWNAYGGEVSESNVVAAANAFVSLGLKAAGYLYVNVDDTWAQTARDATTQRMLPNLSKFPDGINGTAAAVHALGLSFGIYSDAGTATCAGYPGSLYYEDIDAQTWDEWGIDYIKYDNCNVPSNWTDTTAYNGDWSTSNSAIRYRRLTAALQSISRPVLYSICNWGNAQVWTWGSTVGHSWRMTSDASDSWSFITSAITTNVQYLDYVDFYAHNDMDMMEIGNGGLTLQEERTHFAAWAFLKSPILLGTNLTNLSTDEVAVITNPEILAFSQDTTVGAPAKPFTPYTSAPTTSPPEYYSGTSSKGTHVFIINTSSSAATKTFDFANVPGLSAGTYTIHDMWSGTDIGSATDSYSVSVAAHDTAAFLIKSA